MNTYLHILVYFNLLFSMTGVELAKKIKDRPKPFDTQSNSSMILTNKKGKEKNLLLISKSKDDSKKQMIWFLEPKDDYGDEICADDFLLCGGTISNNFTPSSPQYIPSTPEKEEEEEWGPSSPRYEDDQW